MAELRLDLIPKPDLPKLLAGERPPVIVTNRPKREGGRYEGGEENRLRSLEKAMDLGADYVDIEWDSADKLAQKGHATIIVSRHDFRSTPDDVGKWREEMKSKGDIVKIVTTARDISDNFRILDLLGGGGTPTVAFCMGEAGAISRLLAPACGSAWTYAAASKMAGTAPGQFTLDEMRRLYRVPTVTRDTKVFGVIANPVGHSMSPLIHNSAFAELGIDAVYLPLLVTGDPAVFVREFVKRFRAGGFSVTIPHKVAVMEAMDDTDAYVKKAGAMNTVTVRGGRLTGHNTDIPAALDAVDAALAQTDMKTLEGAECLLLGAGGAGRAIGLGIKDRGGQITITDGIAERSEQLAEELGARSVPWEKREDIECSVILNATPVGMHPNADASPVSRRALERASLVFDAVYNPPVTKLLAEAKELGIPTASGLDMFVNQAVLQFELWTGEQAPAALMREKIVERLGEG
jgi:3-dehydroquinate dehydratase/shikimate dehydrogenase